MLETTTGPVTPDNPELVYRPSEPQIFDNQRLGAWPHQNKSSNGPKAAASHTPALGNEFIQASLQTGVTQGSLIRLVDLTVKQLIGKEHQLTGPQGQPGLVKSNGWCRPPIEPICEQLSERVVVGSEMLRSRARLQC